MNGNLFIFVGVVCLAVSGFCIPYGFHLKSKAKQPPLKGGDLNMQADVSAGDGNTADGGNAVLTAGDGQNGASGGDTSVGPGVYKAGDGGTKGKGGDLIIKGGDAR